MSENARDVITSALKEGLKAPEKPEQPDPDTEAPAGEAPVEGESEGDESAQEPPVEEAEGDDTPAMREDGKPFTRKDLQSLQEALKKVRKEAREAKAEATRLAAASQDAKAGADAIAQAETAAAEKYKPLIIRAHARGVFAEAGLSLPEGRSDEVFARAVRLLDMDALTVGDDGVVEGLREQVEEIRADFPELFTTARNRATGAPKVQAAEKTPAPVKKSLDQMLVERLRGTAA